MDVYFREYTSNAYALNPRIERNANQLRLKFDEENCSHFLLFSHTPEEKVDLHNPHLQELLSKMSDGLLREEKQAVTNTISVQCVKYKDYRIRNDYSIPLKDSIAGYTIFGCQMMRQYEPEQFHVIMPQEHMNNSITVSVSVPYRISYFPDNEGAHGANRRGGQAYYLVQFEDVPNYQDGGVVYTLDNIPVSFPITRQMLGGKKLYIDGGKGAPKFRTTVSGLVLKKI